MPDSEGGTLDPDLPLIHRLARNYWAIGVTHADASGIASDRAAPFSFSSTLTECTRKSPVSDTGNGLLPRVISKALYKKTYTPDD